eukprot:3636513-Rhodomonas_salina.2
MAFVLHAIGDVAERKNPRPAAINFLAKIILTVLISRHCTKRPSHQGSGILTVNHGPWVSVPNAHVRGVQSTAAGGLQRRYNGGCTSVVHV